MVTPLTKLVSSGAVALTTAGSAIYFVPKFFHNSSEGAKLIYSESSRFHQEEKLIEFIRREKEILEKIQKELEKFHLATEALGKSKSQEHSNIIQSFQKIEKEEQELQKLYEENQSILKEMMKLGKWEHEASSKKLETEELINRLKFYSELLKSVSNSMHNWGISIQEFICAIENKENGNCSQEATKWFSERNNSSEQTQSLGSHGGGGRRQQGFRASPTTASEFKTRIRERIKKS